MKTYLTESISGLVAGPEITAKTFDQAQDNCPDGFRVVGKLLKRWEAPCANINNLN